MPLHWRRIRERGFNQSQELARYIGLEMSVPVRSTLCTRRQNTVTQTGLTAKERRQNVARAFACDSDLQGRYVVIIDDVMTTGSTAQALSLQLLRAGACRVDVWVCARALL